MTKKKTTRKAGAAHEVPAGPVTAAEGVEHREPEVSTRGDAPPEELEDAPPTAEGPPEPPAEDEDEDRGLWPADKPMPTHWIKTPVRVMPCPNCRRIYETKGGYGQAVRCTSSGFARASFYCACCGHRFTLPVAQVDAEAAAAPTDE